jgi:hypothetical protein
MSRIITILTRAGRASARDVDAVKRTVVAARG